MTTISAKPDRITADSKSTSTVQAMDANNNKETASCGTVKLALPTSGSLSAVQDNRDGTYTAALTSGKMAGKVNITGTIGGTPIGKSTSVTIDP